MAGRGRLLNTVVSLFYYLRWIIPAYRAAETTEPTPPASLVPAVWSARAAVVSAASSVALGIGGGGVWTVLESTLVP